MTIDEYLTETGLTAETLAARAGLTGASLSRIRRGTQNTSRDVMRRLIEASDGMISADALVNHAPANTPAAPGASSGNDAAQSSHGEVSA